MMIDELWHFVARKKVWIWRAIDGVLRRALGWQIGSRGLATMKKLIQHMDTQSCTFVTDLWPGFFKILPEERHFYGKDLTFPIEAFHCDIRHRLARFVRRTKASSRSCQRVEASLSLFDIL